jgi:hypothetical protein
MYKFKELGIEHTIVSKIKIFTEGEKITRVEDRWNDKLPDEACKNVSVSSLSWICYGLSWVIEGGVFCLETSWRQVRTLKLLSYSSMLSLLGNLLIGSCANEADFPDYAESEQYCSTCAACQVLSTFVDDEISGSGPSCGAQLGGRGSQEAGLKQCMRIRESLRSCQRSNTPLTYSW